MQLFLLFFFGLIENLGYLIIGPFIAHFLGLINLQNYLSGVAIIDKQLIIMMNSNYTLPIVLASIYSFRTLYLFQIQKMCALHFSTNWERLKNSVLSLIYSHSLNTTNRLSKALLSDVVNSTYMSYYHRLIVLSSIVPLIIMSVYCALTLGIIATLILISWLSLLYFIVTRLISRSVVLGSDLNETNMSRFNKTAEFVSVSKLALLSRVFDKKWNELKGINNHFAVLQKDIQVLSNLPKLLVEVFLISGLIILYFYYKSQDKVLNDFITIITLVSASLYRLMPLGINAITSLVQIKAVLGQKNALDEFIQNKVPHIDYIKKSNSHFINVKNVFYENRLGSETRRYTIQISEFGLYGFVGKSGSGKSTLSDIISGLVPPTAGDVELSPTFFDQDNQLRVSRSFQDSVIIHGDIFENIKFFGANNKYTTGTVEFLELQHLNDGRILDKDTSNSQISGGEAKRIDIIRALSNDAQLVILDEPESGLDTGSKVKVVSLLKKMSSEKVIIVLTHDPDVMKECKELFFLEKQIQ